LSAFLDAGWWSTDHVRNGTVLLLSGVELFPLPPAFRAARRHEAPSDGLVFLTGGGNGSFELPYDLNSLPIVGSIIIDALVVVLVLACMNFPSASRGGKKPLKPPSELNECRLVVAPVRIRDSPPSDVPLSGGDGSPKTWEGNPETDDLRKVKFGEFPVGGFMVGTQSMLTASVDDSRGDEDFCTSHPGKKL